jgi:lambda family phage portal protein
VAYHIRRAHQNDSYDTGLSMMWDRFERQTDWGRPLVVHDCDRDRAGQHRGIGILTPVLPRFKVLAKYDQVALQAALMRTVFGFFIKSPYDDAQVRQAMETMDTDDRKLYLSGYQSMRQTLGDPNGVSLAGAKIPVMAPGEDIVQVETHGQAEDFDIFEHTFLRGIASCTGESAEEITKDYTHTNYSSARAALLSVWRTMLRRRAGYTTGFCTPIYVAWLEEAVMIRKTVPLPKGAPDFISMRAAYGRCEWIGPGRGWIDPVKERQGEVLGLDAGFGTLRNTCADISGMWWQDVIDERAVEEEYMRERGLTMPDWAAADPVPASLMEEKPQPQ